MDPLTTQAGVVELMSSTRTQEQWRENCDKVKAANGGDYPSFWYGAIIRSGLMDGILGAGASQLKVRVITGVR